MTDFNTIDDLEVSGKTVLVRADLNVPMQDGKVSDTTRIDRLAPTLKELSSKGAKVVVLSHFGRPKNGPDAKNSLRNVLDALSAAVGQKVAFAEDCVGDKAKEAIAKRKRTTRPSPSRWPSWATSTSTTPSPPRTAPTPRPKASPACCRTPPAA